MNILAIDTSTSMATVAIAIGEKIAAEATFSTDRTLSARLVPEIERLLSLAGITMAGIDLFAASIGPGSFTGVRGGVATVQGLALATGRPCVGFSSLSLLAMNFSLASRPVCALLDARKSEVYGALFDCTGPIPAPLIRDTVLPPEQMLDRIIAATAAPVIFCGDGAERYHDLIADRLGERACFAPAPLNAARAANGVTMALHAFRNNELLEPAQLLPVYLRASEAEINRAPKL